MPKNSIFIFEFLHLTEKNSHIEMVKTCDDISDIFITSVSAGGKLLDTTVQFKDFVLGI